ncbi:hypothetical protein CBOM_06623 [Ceraceosorus bombacis]|uniref:Uncharacterized protein n=1 Tax=Ceraceosorus bombacis TaxID=401625 RepID=A0A0N7LAI7_9BASI|nr:hypothetical protein CBOM_06623 [Ceraceosorus bombacis]
MSGISCNGENLSQLEFNFSTSHRDNSATASLTSSSREISLQQLIFSQLQVKHHCNSPSSLNFT